MGKITYLTWPDIQQYCYDLSEQIRKQDFVVDAIVAIQRGGCIPGVLLSHILEITEFYTIGVRTTLTEQIRSARLKKPVVSISDSLRNIKDKKILVVDDVVNTGKTMNTAKEWLESYQPSFIQTLALVWDRSCGSQACPVDFYALHTPDWVVFPWEDIRRE